MYVARRGRGLSMEYILNVEALKDVRCPSNAKTSVKLCRTLEYAKGIIGILAELLASISGQARRPGLHLDARFTAERPVCKLPLKNCRSKPKIFPRSFKFYADLWRILR